MYFPRALEIFLERMKRNGEDIDRMEEGLLNVLCTALGADRGSSDPRSLFATHQKLKQQRGTEHIASLYKISPSDLGAFEEAWRMYLDPTSHDHTRRILRFRFLSWLETIAERSGVEVVSAQGDDDDQVRALKRVRAVELILRSLILETHRGHDALIGHLERNIPGDLLEKWRSAAQKGNILSGTTFSELASLFVAKEEFPRYEALFTDDAHLRLLRTKRATVRAYLDDIRRVRNVVAHHKQLSDVQAELLDLYYHDLVTPIQQAKDQGVITTDPKKFLDVSKEELTAFFNGVREDIQAVRDDVGQLRGEVREGFTDLKGAAARNEERLGDIQDTLRTSWLSRKMVFAYAVIGIALVASGFLYQHYTHRPFAATIHVHGPKGSTDRILSNKGKVLLKAVDFQAEAPINENGDAVFAQLPSTLLEGAVQLDVEAMGEAYAPIRPANAFVLQRDAHVQFPIHLSGSERLRGLVRDLATGAPVPNAQVRIKTLQASTDAAGRFDLPIPLELREAFQDVEVTCKGYTYYQDKQVPLQGDGEMEVMLEPME